MRLREGKRLARGHIAKRAAELGFELVSAQSRTYSFPTFREKGETPASRYLRAGSGETPG